MSNTRALSVWLDDERSAPSCDWIVATTAQDAILLLRTGQVATISLDHDLGDDASGTGYDVLLWIERAVAERGFRPPVTHVHTANPPARIRMLAAVEAISRIVAASATVPDTPETRLAALPPGYVETVVAKSREALGDALQEVILYGSRAYGRPGPDSDCDIALVVTERTWLDGKDQYELASDVNNVFHYQPRTEFHVSTREDIESYRGVAMSMQSHILERGIRLYVSDRAAVPGKVVEPKTHHSIAIQWLMFAEGKIRTIEHELSDIEIGRFPASVIDTEYLFYAACWSFKAVLFARGINCAERKLRWNLPPLQRLASLFEPAMRPLSAAISALPWYYDQFRYGHIDWQVNGRTREELQAALAAARRIYATCAKATLG